MKQIWILAGPNGSGKSTLAPRLLRDVLSLGDYVNSVSFAFETTLASRTYVPWVRRVRGEGYEVQMMFLWLRIPDLAIERVRERARIDGHNVPEEVSPNLSVIAFGRSGKPVDILEETEWKMFKDR